MIFEISVSSRPHLAHEKIPRESFILIVAFFLSFCVTVAVNYSFSPEKLSDAEHLRLQTENQSLEIANKNAEIRTERLEAKLKKLQALSYRINALIEAD